MSYYDAMRKLAQDDPWPTWAEQVSGAPAPDGSLDDDPDDEECPTCGLDGCEGCDDAEPDDMYDDEGDFDDSNEGRLRQRITDAMPEGDPEAYMASGQDLLNELLANPDRTKLELILDKEIEELSALLGDTSDIDLEELKSAALAAFDVAAERDGPNKGAIMAALAAIKSAAGSALGALGLR